MAEPPAGERHHGATIRCHLPSECRNQEKRRSGVDGNVLVEAFSGRVQHPGGDVVGVAEHKRVKDPVGGAHSVDELIWPVGGREVAAVVPLFRSLVTTVRAEPGNDPRRDAVSAGSAGD